MKTRSKPPYPAPDARCPGHAVHEGIRRITATPLLWPRVMPKKMEKKFSKLDDGEKADILEFLANGKP
jgi:hypothetical protein